MKIVVCGKYYFPSYYWDKRNMKKWFQKFYSSGSFIPFLLLWPYVFTIIVNGTDKALGFSPLNEERIVPVLLMAQLDGDYEPETIKAQAVIARSEIYRKPEKILEEIISTEDGIWNDGKWNVRKLFIQSEKLEQYQDAARKTEGQVLVYKGELKLLPYHEISCGKTRDGEEAFHSQEFAYLKSVDSSQDKKAPDYINSTYVSESQLPKSLVIKERDSAGYVTALTADGYWLEGEAFRKGMHLASGNFSVQKIGKAVRFLCKGKGHGIGFSQYGGNEMAKSGSSWKEIIMTYFPEMEIQDIREMKKSE